MKTYLRLACVAFALVLPLGALKVDVERKQLEKRPFESRLPDRIGDWTAVDEGTLQPEVVEMLAPESYSMRYFTARDRPSIWIYAAFYRGDRTGAPHDPMICYPAQGWSISEDREMQLDLGPEQSIPVRFMRGELSDADELVLYWRQPVGRWPGRMPSEYFLRLRDRALGGSEYAFLRISLRRPRASDGISDTDMKALQAAAAAIAPWARDTVAAGSEL